MWDYNYNDYNDYYDYNDYNDYNTSISLPRALTHVILTPGASADLGDKLP